MKKSIFRFRRIVARVAAGLLLAPVVASAQMPGGGAGVMDSAFLKLFGTHSNFTCKAEFHLMDALSKELDVTPFTFTVSEGKMRMDIDFAQIKGTDIPPAMMTTLKQLGMDQSVIILRPDKQMVISIYPKAHAYSERVMSKEDVAASQKVFAVTKDKLGRETVDGHACDKTKMTLVEDKGTKHVTTVWSAADLKDFPVQIQMTDPDPPLLMKFREVKLGKPDAARFEAPAGLTKYKSDEALMEAATKGTLPK